MAISRMNGCRDLLVKAIGLVDVPMRDLAICELGCQVIKTDPGSGMRRLQSAKSVFDWLGVRYRSIDISGKFESLPYDLSQPIMHTSLFGAFDIVTNFGTSEHVRRSQRECFANIHRLCKVGGVMVHAVPAITTLERHGYWRYSFNWFSWLANRQEYVVERQYVHDKSQGYWEKYQLGECIYAMAIFRKIKDTRFRWRRWRDPEWRKR